MTLAILFGMFIYGNEVCEVYMPLEEKASAEWGKKMDEQLSDSDKKIAEFRKVEETQDKSTPIKGDPNLMV